MSVAQIRARGSGPARQASAPRRSSTKPTVLARYDRKSGALFFAAPKLLIPDAEGRKDFSNAIKAGKAVNGRCFLAPISREPPLPRRTQVLPSFCPPRPIKAAGPQADGLDPT